MRKLILFLYLSCFSLSHAQEISSATLLAEWMQGSYSSKAQSKADTAFMDVSMEVVRIWPERTDAIWLYVEQALSSDKKKPYRQRIYKIVSDGKDKSSSYVYDFSSKKDFIGAYKKPKSFNKLDHSQLKEMVGCAVTFIFVENQFIGTTAEVCENSWSSAAYASSEVEVTINRIVSWDRGWSKEGKQVWGSTKGGYIFIKK